jgi:hypothetical protein
VGQRTNSPLRAKYLFVQLWFVTRLPTQLHSKCATPERIAMQLYAAPATTLSSRSTHGAARAPLRAVRPLAPSPASAPAVPRRIALAA